VKAIALISGGLDSALAAKIVLEQGIQVIGLFAKTPFLKREPAVKISENLGIPLHVVETGEDYLNMILHPVFGYGKALNPCIDCHIFFLKIAKELMVKEGASFVVTGEVVGQRPMSQRPETIKLIEREAGLEGLVLRPLSAGLLPPSRPEEEGWVDRKKLFAIKGRGRKIQLSLAEKFSLKDYSPPAGGCLLTEPLYARKLRDLINYGEFNTENINLLRIGRHFRLPHGAKLILGRDEAENKFLVENQKNWLVMEALEVPSPIGLFRGSAEDLLFAVSILLTYSDAAGSGRVKAGNTVMEARAMDKGEIEKWRI